MEAEYCTVALKIQNRPEKEKRNTIALSKNQIVSNPHKYNEINVQVNYHKLLETKALKTCN